jgi:hypothetical protein
MTSASLNVGLNMNDFLRISSSSHILTREFLEVLLCTGLLKAVGTSKIIDLFINLCPQVGYILLIGLLDAVDFIGVNATRWGNLFGDREFLRSGFID